MKKSLSLFAATLIVALASCSAFAAPGDKVTVHEPFDCTVLAEGLDMPWEIVWGPDGMLWVTERLGKRIVRIDPASGAKHTALTIDEAVARGGHEGVIGLVLAPDLLQPDSKNYVFTSYTYTRRVSNVDLERKKIVRYQFDKDSGKLINPHTILEDIPGGDDHNAARLAIGPDGKLYFSLGELGHNQGANMSKPIEAQRLPKSEELFIRDWSSYVGKVLRMNLDGSIPSDNPVIKDVQSHIFTYGHRNPQGLAFVGDTLFSCEHGPSVDDEVNRLEPGGNYGWPHVAGFRDDQSYRYANWSQATPEAIKNYDPNKPDTIPAGVPVYRETDWHAPDFREPVKTFHTVPNGYNFKDPRFEGLDYLFWPTVAPSSLVYYPEDGPIAHWRNSLLMTTLKTGLVYRMKMNADKATVQGDAIGMFHTPNRYRAACLNPAADTLYVITDSAGNALDRDGNPTQSMQNPGSILVFKYNAAK